jgi:hypothetical protein
MTRRPGAYPLLIPQGADLLERIVLPFSCVGRELEAHVWNPRRTKLLLDLDVTIVEAARLVEGSDPAAYEAEIKLSALWELTRRLKGTGLEQLTVGMWDLLVVDLATGKRDYWLRGPALLDPRATEVLA